jgi:hypothetical protein
MLGARRAKSPGMIPKMPCLGDWRSELMAKRPSNDGAGWSAGELRTLKQLAKAGTPTSAVAKELGRTAAAVQQKAMRAGISFRAAKKSAARKKK